MAAAAEGQDNSEEKKPSDETEMTSVSTKNNKIKLEDLKVADLKNELEKRKLDKNGVKSVLVERLKAAIVEEGEDPAEFQFEIITDSISNEIPLKETKIGTLDTSETKDTNDDVNQEEKQDIALQLSLDEEEAQLNDESLIEIAKLPDAENSEVKEMEQSVEDFSGNENAVPDKQSTPPKVSKTENEDTKDKKGVKSPVQNKSTASTASISPKVLKVVGKGDKLKNPNVLAKSLWVTGLPNTTRAADLKVLFSKQGRVLSVKIVKSAKQTPGKCYGYVTMASSKDATKAIQNLHRIELNGRVISVERKQSEPNSLLKKLDSKLLNFTTAKKVALKKEALTSKQMTNEKKYSVESKNSSKIENKLDEKKKGSDVSGKKTDEKGNSADRSKDKDRKFRERRDKEKDADRLNRRPPSFRPRSFGNSDRSRFNNFRRPFGRRPFSGGSSFRPRTNTLQNFRDDRFQRERLRERREAERRREDELLRHRLIERKQREEAYRLEREKERLRIERELLERERAEILKLEREKAILERERLERERDELRRQAAKRPFSRDERDSETIWDERKKLPARYDMRSGLHGESSSAARFTFPQRERSSFSREYERLPDKYSAPKHLDVLPRLDLADRDARRDTREITIRTRDERQILSRGDFRDRDNRRMPSRDQERHTTARRDVTRNDWKQDRRVHERITNNSSAPRRMNYY